MSRLAHNAHATLAAFARETSHAKIQEYVDLIENVLDELDEAASIDEFHGAILLFDGLKAPKLGKNDEEIKEAYQDVIEPWKAAQTTLKKRLRSLFLESDADLIEALANPSQRMKTIFGLAMEFMTEWPNVVREKRLSGFGDLFNDALYLLEQFPDVRLKYQTEINEIMVDEYQDTNDLQDYMLSLIAKGNLFLVGDVKQSIYGFRDANPTNFMAKAKAYEQGGDGVLITLAENFRSRPEIIRGINRLFVSLMDDDLGGADYRHGHELVFGNQDYLKAKSNSEDPFGIRLDVYPIPEDDVTPKALIEGRLIAIDILAKRQRGFQVRDLINHTDRLTRFRDFAIIVDRKSGFHHYQKALMDAQIPVMVVGDEEFIAAAEILVCTNALRLIACFQNENFETKAFKRAFYGLARSFVCEIADEDIVALFLDHPFRTHADLAVLKDHPSFSRYFLIFTKLALLANDVSLADLFMAMANELALFDAIRLLDDPQSAEEKLLYLKSKLNQFEGMDLLDAIAYLEAIEQSDHLDIEFQRPMPDGYDAVTLLTMHKAKGLEFPICYYPGLDKRFHRPENKNFVQFDPEYGLVSKAMKNGTYDTALHVLLDQKRRRTDLSERIRLFYVALTRAKEQAILFLPESIASATPRIETTNDGTLTRSTRLRANAFSDWLTMIPVVREWHRFVPDTIAVQKTASLLSGEDPIQPIAINERHYTPLPIVVTRYSKAANLQPTQAMREAMIYGETLHRAIEELDFKSPDWHRVNEAIVPILKRFLASPLLQLEGATMFKEVPLMDDAGRIAILDLIIESKSEIHIVDYKTKTIRKPEYEVQVGKYATLLRNRTSKPVFGWLYSLLDGDWIAVEDQ
ncbi:MAG: UvrD-helicase domain-containing protein [Bacillus subtilis]|nr:UvrD-helicase domain-containing protein [Bacillus subtilis]